MIDVRAATVIGRAARLELAFGVRRGRTIVEHAYAEPPFKIGRTFDVNGAAYAIVVCSGAGLFGGDRLLQSIHVARGARVVLTSQAALQFHPSPPPLPSPASHDPSSRVQSCNPATLQCRCFVEPEAELHCHWDPVIPFAGAQCDQRFDIQIDESSRLYWGDAMMAGRVSRGEAWRFDSFAHQLALRRGDSLVYLERYRLLPRERIVDRQWIGRSASYLGTTLIHHPAASRDQAERLQRAFADSPVRAAVDFLAPRLLVCRVTAMAGPAFARLRTRYREAALDGIFQAPELACRK